VVNGRSASAARIHCEKNNPLGGRAVNASRGQWRGDGKKGNDNGQMSLWRAWQRVQVVGKANTKVTGTRCQERWQERLAERPANRLA